MGEQRQMKSGNVGDLALTQGSPACQDHKYPAGTWSSQPARLELIEVGAFSGCQVEPKPMA